ncbi:MAG: DNA polymerase III subunit beta [Actinobacteria bacterium]|nr:DNA polymerase III subunit beta [Actinomycetota bacterium]
MKFRVDHDILADAVGWVARALPTRPVVPVLSGLRLDADAGGLALSCFDYELSATVGIAAQVEEPGTALVPGRLLAEIVRSLPGEPAEFTTDGDAVLLTCGSAEFELVALPLAEYPALPAPPPLAGTIDGGELAAALTQVLPAASRDDTLPMLTGVRFDIDGDTMTLAATDRYRLAVRDVQWSPARPGLRAAALVPARTLADAARSMAPGVPVSVAFTAAGADGPAERGQAQTRSASAGSAHSGPVPSGPAHSGPAPSGPAQAAPPPAEGMISFATAGRRLATRLIAGEFIRYQSRFPASFGCWAEVPAASFIEAVRRVSLVADRASPVRLSFGHGTVAVEAATEGRARAAETVTANFHGDQPVIAFNPHYLLDGLVAAAAANPSPDPAAAGEQAGAETAKTRSVPSPATIRMDFTSPAKPALITRAAAGGGQPDSSGAGGRPAFRYLVVPLRPAASG